MSQNNLFSPIKMGPHTLKNRAVMAPLTRNRSTESYAPHALNVTYYKQRATAGLIITEGSQISPQGLGYPLTPGIYNDEQIAGWKNVTDAVHSEGGHIFLQLWHVGRISHPSMQADGKLPVAPSAIKPDGDCFTYTGPQAFVEPHALTTEEIADIIDDYTHAAESALEAGFDGVEVHAANGYLIDQFLRDGSNQRTDEFGGSLENRTRFLKQVLDTVTNVWGSDRVGVRLSPLNSFNTMSDSNPEALFSYVVEHLNAYDLAYLHAVEGSIMTPIDEGTSFDVKSLSKKYQGNYIANSGYTKQIANEAIESEHAEMISFGVDFLANPDLVERLQHDQPLNTADPETFYGGDGKGYTDYPFLEAVT